MSRASDGVELTRVGPGTVMGDLMRCYWIPALKSSELVRDGAPVSLLLLGEKLVAFRDSAGRVGVMDHRQRWSPRHHGRDGQRHDLDVRGWPYPVCRFSFRRRQYERDHHRDERR